MFTIRGGKVIQDQDGPVDWRALTRKKSEAECRMTLIGATINEKLRRGEDVPPEWSRELRELREKEGK